MTGQSSGSFNCRTEAEPGASEGMTRVELVDDERAASSSASEPDELVLVHRIHPSYNFFSIFEPHVRLACLRLNFEIR
jgi:hypothetical protein